MSTPKIIRAAQQLLRQVSQMAHGLGKALVSWLLRGLFVVGRQPLLSKGGFVLPTTVLLLLVVVLTVGAISYRTFTRTQQSISGRQQQVIYNAATPVIDRAKSKIEFLFDRNKDPRGTTITPQPQLLSMMLNDGQRNATKLPADPYTFDGEKRIDVNGDGTDDNAWLYPVDLDGDGVITKGKDGTAVYSIIFTAPTDGAELRDARVAAWQKRANSLEVRNAPLSNASQSDNICERNDSTGAADVPLVNGVGWFPDQTNRTKIRKNFQVSAYVVPDNPNTSVATLEFQQDREATQGFKWAAWFRNDLEIFPGPAFSWNGAMHTEGSLIVGGSDAKFRAFLVSSNSSCINDKSASEITVKQNAENVPIQGTPAFKGRFIAGTIRDNNFNGFGTFDLPTNAEEPNPRTMKAAEDSLAPGNLKPIDFSLEPVTLQTKGLSIARNPSARPVDAYEDGTWGGNPLHDGGNSRLYTDANETTPYVDDTFRADNRWGPKPTWGPKGLPIGVTTDANADTTATAKIGEDIEGVIELTGSDPKPGEDTAESVGLDGYWERRARVEGLRLIVGQRLELGDPAGWGGPGGQGPAGNNDAPITGNNQTDALNNSLQRSEPLRPWRQGCTAGDSCNEERQRKTLWDNLAAVQATAVYHNATDGSAADRDFPDACLITTIHPGTPTTLDRSATFENLAYGLEGSGAIDGYTNAPNPLVITDVFRGRGTNGWEFDIPTAADFRNTNSSLMKGLANLANFAGDPNGGAPSFRVNQIAGQPVHPYPSMAMWGDFSMLRRVLQEVNKVGYEQLSPADKTTLHTAGCTLGMLAYNVDYLEKFRIAAVEAERKPLIGFTDSEVVTAVTGTAPPAGTGINLQANPGMIAAESYSEGLRGRIRVIDHLVQGVITPAQAQTIFAENLPPAGFVDSLANLTSPTPPNPMMQLLSWDPSQSNNPETYVRLLERWRDAIPVAEAAKKDEMNKIISLAQLIVSKEQVARDRTWGFFEFADFPNKRFYSTAPLGDCGMTLDGTNKTPGWLSQAAVSLTDPSGATNKGPVQPDPLGRLCSARPRYPILFSLFPARLPDFLAPPADIAAGYAGGFLAHGDISDATVAEAVRDFEDRQSNIASYIEAENGGVTYAVIKPEDIKLNPLTLSQGGATLGGGRRSGGGAWVLPTAISTVTGPTPNNNQYNLLKLCSGRCSQPADANSSSFQLPVAGNALVRVAVKDGAFYNGREMMPVRTLDLDLDLMRSTAYQGDLWLPKRGIVYAFREDAVSESHIVRPPTISDWNRCDTDAELQTATCQMTTATVAAYRSLDPPVNADNGISTKPVDYYPDPDRRPYGFRLRQGSNLSRTGDEGLGLSFISDNPVYIQGDFNLHQKGGSPLEEFAEPLTFDNDGYANFYQRKKLDLLFATREGDDWRPSEIVADAVSLISSNFCDGSIQDGFDALAGSTVPVWLRDRYGCSGGATVTSFLNQNRPKERPAIAALTTRGVLWERANMIDSFPKGLIDGSRVRSGHNVDEGESPIYLSRNNKPVHWKNLEGQNKLYANTYVITKDNKNLIPATENRMNMIVVSGLVPSRLGQSYGGLHNFPRFIENWGSKNLYISGAFLQLSFSNYATAPFDQEAWQPGAPAPTIGGGVGNEWIRYYTPPNRRWGYDVGLQYAPSGPVAQRFQFAEDTRSEFYTEPPANDPYIRNLCLQVRDAAQCP